MKIYSHYQVCLKVCHKSVENNSTFTSEANILSLFAHPNLPYLFGVCIGESPSIVTSYHGLDNHVHSVTIDSALFTQSETIKQATDGINWLSVLNRIVCGLDHLHTKH